MSSSNSSKELEGMVDIDDTPMEEKHDLKNIYVKPCGCRDLPSGLQESHLLTEKAFLGQLHFQVQPHFQAQYSIDNELSATEENLNHNPPGNYRIDNELSATEDNLNRIPLFSPRKPSDVASHQ